MPRLSTCLAVWILMLLFDSTVTEKKLYPKRNISILNLQKEREFSNGILRLENDQIAKRERRNVMEDKERRTLIDYNGPEIIEDLDNKYDQNFVDHVRIKRNEPTLIHRHRLNYSANAIDFFPRNFWSKTDAINGFDNSTSESKGSLNSDHWNRSSVLRKTIADMPHLRYKREVLSQNRKREKRAKGNIAGHPKHRVGTENRNKKHGTSKSSRKPVKKKTNNSKKKSKKTEKKTEIMLSNFSPISESRIEKRESGMNNSLNADLARTGIADYDQQKGDAVSLPFVHTGRAKLRVRIEKIPRNESLFVIDNWTDRSIGTSTCCPATLLKFDDETFGANATNLESVPNVDYTGREKDNNNLTVEITVQKLDCGNVSSRETSDSGDALSYDAASYPVESDLSRIEDDQNLESDNRAEISVQSSDEDAKSRAKRNQEITSRRYLRSDRNTMTGSKRFKNAEQGTSIEGTKHEKTNHRSRGDRAVRSIEEIKELAEKLVVKVNELQMYMSDRNKTRYTTDICVGKNADHVAIEGTPRISSEKKHVAKTSTSEIVENVDNRRHSARNSGRVTLAGKRASSRMPSGGSRFARGENPIQRKSRRKWGRWMDWSSCSVTCGKGRQIRWRHCLRDCNDAETEMEEKACQLPACPPGKFLGIF